MNHLQAAPVRASSMSGGQLIFSARLDISAQVAGIVSADEVCDLIDAAGPLTLCDIAGGLAVTTRQAVACIRQMLRDRSLQQDEFGRYRLIGARA